MFGLRIPELLLIFLVVVLLFGAKKLPQLGQGLGDSIKSFRKALKDANTDAEGQSASMATKDAQVKAVK
jgi:sec-independent protein translocase protein TatA